MGNCIRCIWRSLIIGRFTTSAPIWQNPLPTAPKMLPSWTTWNARLARKSSTHLGRSKRLSTSTYGGIDSGLNDRGDVLLFEANATMAVIVPDEDDRWDYRRSAVHRIYSAVDQMLRDRAKNAVAASEKEGLSAE